jgi:hypothetical protein
LFNLLVHEDDVARLVPGHAHGTLHIVIKLNRKQPFEQPG